MGKVSKPKDKQRHDPLYKDLTTEGGNLRSKARGKKKEEKNEDEEYVDSASSRKILQLAKEQQEELEKEEREALREESKFSFGSRFTQGEEDDDEEEEEEEENYENISEFGGSDEEYEIDEEEINEDDARLFEQYLEQSQGSSSFGAGGSYNLADKIMASIREKEEKEAQLENESKAVQRPVDAVLLPPKVIAAYTQVGQILTTWTHGKLPKLFKVIPSLNNWEDVLYVTNPDAWTPQVVYEATKLFVSNLTSKQAEKFVQNVLLERFRSEIEDSEDHNLNYHIYRALKKALYKPGAFFKGFLFPLVQSSCSVREATIAGSVLIKISIPALHSSVALNYLLNLDFTPATTVFIRILLEKKYALPYQIVDNLVFYFMKFRILKEDSMYEDAKPSAPLPVVWHKAFLAFAQRYKNDITEDQRDFLLETVRQRGHKDIGPEIRRELLAGIAREPANNEDDKMADF